MDLLVSVGHWREQNADLEALPGYQLGDGAVVLGLRGHLSPSWASRVGIYNGRTGCYLGSIPRTMQPGLAAQRKKADRPFLAWPIPDPPGLFVHSCDILR